MEHKSMAEKYPKAYKYMQYLLKKHGIKKEELISRARAFEVKYEELQKLPEREYREIDIVLPESALKHERKLIGVI